jgi:hypothetical protein
LLLSIFVIMSKRSWVSKLSIGSIIVSNSLVRGLF